MQKFIKLLVLTSCIFLALVKTSGAQIFVQNAVQRTQVHVSAQKDIALSDDSSKSGLEQKETNLKIHLSAHVLGDINGSALVFLPLGTESGFSISIIGNVLSGNPSSIYRPPRLV
jgi:hypothetical protein